MPASCVYLIEAQNSLVKIGYSANVRDRLTSVRTHSPVLVRLIAMWPGSAAEEAELHCRFAAYRQHGEWFALSGTVTEFVSTVRGRGVPSVVDWDDLRFEARASFQQARAAQGRAVARAKKAELDDILTPPWVRAAGIESEFRRLAAALSEEEAASLCRRLKFAPVSEAA